jgi:hypothetical protein
MLTTFGPLCTVNRGVFTQRGEITRNFKFNFLQDFTSNIVVFLRGVLVN